MISRTAQNIDHSQLVAIHLYCSILDAKEHPVNVLSVSTLQYVNHNASMLPLNWKSKTKIFAECFTFKKLCD